MTYLNSFKSNNMINTIKHWFITSNISWRYILRAKPGLHDEWDCTLSLNLTTKRECALSLDCTLSEVSNSSNSSSRLFLQFLHHFSFKALEFFFFWLLLIKNCKYVNFFAISLKTIIKWRNYNYYWPKLTMKLTP